MPTKLPYDPRRVNKLAEVDVKYERDLAAIKKNMASGSTSQSHIL